MSAMLRPIDAKRDEQAIALQLSDAESDDIWFVHTVLAQCFLPYRDPKTRDWQRSNGKYGIILTSGTVRNSENPSDLIDVGLPFGAKPRLFQSYICTQAVKQKSPVISVEHSMTAMIQELGFEARGGRRGTINSFKDQIIRFARCRYTLVAPGAHGAESYIEAPPVKKMNVWFPDNPKQGTLWTSEIVLTDDYYHSLRDHAVPFDFRGMRAIQAKPRAQDIYLWMTQRLCRLSNKPLLMKWRDLYEMFGGNSVLKEFKRKFPVDLHAAQAAYPAARIDEHAEGYLFWSSPPPIPKTKIAFNARLS